MSLACVRLIVVAIAADGASAGSANAAGVATSTCEDGGEGLKLLQNKASSHPSRALAASATTTLPSSVPNMTGTHRMELVGNGFCINTTSLGPSSMRLNRNPVWQNTPVRADGGADLCDQLCADSRTCVGYLTEDDSKCALIDGVDVALEGTAGVLAGTDQETRNYCWVKSVHWHVGNGWCLDENGSRLHGNPVWNHTNVRSDGGADLCDRLCALSSTCIGYMTEDGTKCSIIDTATLPPEQQGHHITQHDGQVRNHCWVRATPSARQTNAR